SRAVARARGSRRPGLGGARAPVAPLQFRPDPPPLWDPVPAAPFIHRRDADLLLPHPRFACVAGAQYGGVTVTSQLLALQDIAAGLDQNVHPRLERVGDLELFARGNPHLTAGVLADDLQGPLHLR